MKIMDRIREKDIDVLILIVMLLIIPVFVVQVVIADELWNFAFVYKMNIGYIPYTDLNIIIPPIFHIIGLMFLKLFGANFLAFRIYNFITLTIMLFLNFKIFKKLKINKIASIVYIIILYYLFMTMYSGGASYNFLAYIPIFITLLLIISNKENYFLYGMLIFVTILIKQNLGVYLGIGVVLNVLVQRKNIIKNILKLFLVNAIGILVFLFILYQNEILYDFYLYVVSGVEEFAIKNISMSLGIMGIVVICCVNVIITYFVSKLETGDKIEKIENLNKMYCIGLPMLLCAYPIFNTYHIYMAIYVLCISYIYIVHSILLNEIISKDLFKKIMIFLLIIIGIDNIFTVVERKKEYNIVTDHKSVYYGALMNVEMKNNIENICDFIEESEQRGYKVVILSDKANLYMVPLNKNNNEMDLPFKGNLGKNGLNKLIETIKTQKNTLFLIVTNEEDMFWQEYKEIREFIQSNLEKVGQIEEYDIYLNR